MKTTELKITRIGNSRGIRLTAASLKRYAIEDTVIMEERSEGILLRVPGPATPKLSWDETAHAMAVAAEDWSEWALTGNRSMSATYTEFSDLKDLRQSP